MKKEEQVREWDRMKTCCGSSRLREFPWGDDRPSAPITVLAEEVAAALGSEPTSEDKPAVSLFLCDSNIVGKDIWRRAAK
jgi:hypothetical protein